MLQQSRFSRLSGWILLVFIYYIAAASSFGGFMLKWQFSEGTRYTLPMMLDGTADRPFVYRQLLPMVANEVGALIPERVQASFLNKLAEDPPVSNPIHRYFPNASDAANPRYALRYFVVYALSFVSMFMAMFLVRAVCLEMKFDKTAATLTPLVIALIFPLIQTEGGYFYDMPELMFMALGTLLAARGKTVMLAIVTIVATLNKESYLLFLLTLMPLMMTRFSIKRTALTTGGLLVLAALVNMAIKHKYALNDGGVIEFQLSSHLQYLLNPRNYLRTEINYGMLTTKGFNLLNLLLFALVFKSGWQGLPRHARQQGLIGIVLTVPLFIAFCYRDELRNLSFMWMTFSLVVCATISVALSAAHAHTRNESRVESGLQDLESSLSHKQPEVATR
ncbi:hypothetical protein [Caballeronia sp. LZ035]|uniref:hypothetical protein n=1 Tax=Caballeronia sp. LZ035 TaxID=3038568 RepID=UPI00285F2B5B|nr:hypothetical protein [Caballeronia sp. LZ035]MDR5759100.1 hypothetical protein [Caballeronia sp. LZ035]